jgi:hypothetical protein
MTLPTGQLKPSWGSPRWIDEDNVLDRADQIASGQDPKAGVNPGVGRSHGGVGHFTRLRKGAQRSAPDKSDSDGAASAVGAELVAAFRRLKATAARPKPTWLQCRSASCRRRPKLRPRQASA